MSRHGFENAWAFGCDSALANFRSTVLEWIADDDVLAAFDAAVDDDARPEPLESVLPPPAPRQTPTVRPGAMKGVRR